MNNDKTRNITKGIKALLIASCVAISGCAVGVVHAEYDFSQQQSVNPNIINKIKEYILTYGSQELKTRLRVVISIVEKNNNHYLLTKFIADNIGNIHTDNVHLTIRDLGDFGAQQVRFLKMKISACGGNKELANKYREDLDRLIDSQVTLQVDASELKEPARPSAIARLLNTEDMVRKINLYFLHSNNNDLINMLNYIEGNRDSGSSEEEKTNNKLTWLENVNSIILNNIDKIDYSSGVITANDVMTFLSNYQSFINEKIIEQPDNNALKVQSSLLREKVANQEMLITKNLENLLNDLNDLKIQRTDLLLKILGHIAVSNINDDITNDIRKNYTEYKVGHITNNKLVENMFTLFAKVNFSTYNIDNEQVLTFTTLSKKISDIEVQMKPNDYGVRNRAYMLGQLTPLLRKNINNNYGNIEPRSARVSNNEQSMSDQVSNVSTNTSSKTTANVPTNNIRQSSNRNNIRQSSSHNTIRQSSNNKPRVVQHVIYRVHFGRTNKVVGNFVFKLNCWQSLNLRNLPILGKVKLVNKVSHHHQVLDFIGLRAAKHFKIFKKSVYNYNGNKIVNIYVKRV